MFLSFFRAEVDDRSPYGDFWFTPVTMRSISGAPVSSETAMQLSAVFRAVRLISGQIASLPLRLYRTKPNGGKEYVTDHWLYRLLARRPNRWQNAFEWRQMMQGHLELRGNCYNRIIPDGSGGVAELLPIHPDRMKIEIFSDGNYRWRIANRDGTEEIVSRQEIWHRRGFSWDGYLGVSVIAVARESIAVGLSAQEYGGRFFANDARPSGGWIEYPSKFADHSTRDAFRESWRKAQAGEHRGKIAVLENGMKYHEVGLTNEDAQFLETRKFQVSEIARWFDVPPHKIGDLERSTNNNIEQQSLDFMQDCLTPRAEGWEASVENELIGDDEKLEIEFDFANLLRGDSKARVAYYNGGILNGWLTRNEARIAENLNPLEGLDEPLQPLNMTADLTATDNADTQDAPPASPTKDGTSDARLVAIAQAAAERVARREANVVAAALEGEGDSWLARLCVAYAEHASFVASTLGVSGTVANEYCQQQYQFAAGNQTMPREAFVDAARSKLERLALKGSL